MERRGRKNNGNQKDVVILEQLESALQDNEFSYDPSVTITVSTANLKWLIEKAGRWVRRDEGK